MGMLAATACSQPSIKFRPGNEAKSFGKTLLTDAVGIGAADGYDYWLHCGDRNGIGILSTDSTLHHARQTTLPHSSHYTMLAASHNDRQVALLLADAHSSHEASILTARIALDTLENYAFDELKHYDLGRHDQFYCWGASSPNGQYNAVVAVVEYTDSKQYEATVMLLDAEMRPLWEREYAVGTLEEVAVSDEGCIVTLGCEQSDFGADLVFNIFTASRSRTCTIASEAGYIRHLHLAHLTQHHALAMGTFSPAHLKGHEHLCGGLYTVAISLDSATVTHSTLRRFTDEDIAVFYNHESGGKGATTVADHVEVVDLLPTASGALLALERHFAVDSHGDTLDEAGSTTYHVGLQIASADTLGRLQWVRNVRSCDVRKGNDESATSLLLAWGEGLAIVKNENSKTPDNYTTATPVRPCEGDAKSNLVVYLVDGDGAMVKQRIEGKTRHTALAANRRSEGRWQVVTANKSALRPAILEIR